MRKGLLLATLLLGGFPAMAADLPTFPIKAPQASSCLAVGNCSGGYLDFGLNMNAALSSTFLNNASTGQNNGAGINVGAGYQLWTGQVLAGIEGNVGYQGGTAGSTGTFTSTQFVKLGYNFFPAAASAAPTPSQNPFAGLVPANLLANSTPAVIAGGCYGHGIEKACAGLEVDTVIAKGWSTAFQWYNAPNYKGQADENVFRVLVQKHF
jgi:hypothetical protein